MSAGIKGLLGLALRAGQVTTGADMALKEIRAGRAALALLAGVLGLVTSYYLGCSTGAVISLYLAVFFAVTFCLRKIRG